MVYQNWTELGVIHKGRPREGREGGLAECGQGGGSVTGYADVCNVHRADLKNWQDSTDELCFQSNSDTDYCSWHGAYHITLCWGDLHVSPPLVLSTTHPPDHSRPSLWWQDISRFKDQCNVFLTMADVQQSTAHLSWGKPYSWSRIDDPICQRCHGVFLILAPDVKLQSYLLTYLSAANSDATYYWAQTISVLY